jgi:hypothetical protein
MLINDLPGSDRKYPVLCHALIKGSHEIQYGLITNPFKTRQPSGHTSYGFCFGGCVWYYIIDSREVAAFSTFTRSLQNTDLQMQKYSAILGQDKHYAHVSRSHQQ